MARKKRRSYTLEFKKEAIRLVNEHDMTYADAAKDLGIDRSTLRQWCIRAEEGALEGRPGRAAPEETIEDEVTRLRREVRILREEREIPKKAAAFFAKENQ